MRKWSSQHPAVLFILLAGAALAAAFGYISPDSWEYLIVAQSIRDGAGCSAHGAYFAVLPCGYPLVLALTAPASDVASLILGSKLTNLLLLVGVYFFVANTFRNCLVPVLLVLNPVTMVIYQYTWSENLFLFAVCGALMVIQRIDRAPADRSALALLTVFLLIGCSARYFFGPFAALMFLGIGVVYGWKKALITLPAFAVAGAFFLAYQWLNVEMSGYATGMPRLAAQESIGYLLLRFAKSFANVAFRLSLGFAILLALAWKCWRFLPSIGAEDDDRRACLYLLWLGIAYLVLAFCLRALTHFDMYDTRTLGYGLVFSAAGLVGLTTRSGAASIPLPALLCSGVFALLVGHGATLSQLKDALAGHYRSPLAALREYRAQATDADLVVALSVPDVSPMIDANDGLYYRDAAHVLSFAAAPFRKAESLDEFRVRVLQTGSASCLIDFTRYQDRNEIERYVSRRYEIDLVHDAATGEWLPTTRQRLEPSAQAYLLRRYEPERYVACNDLLGS